jgi:peroxiredoxin
MKKSLKILIISLFVTLLGFIGFKVVTKVKYKNQVAQNIKTIPKFKYQNINGGIFTNKNLKLNIPTIFIYYNSECNFCNEETQLIQENIAKFKDIQLVFVSFEKPEKIVAFAKKHKLDQYDKVTFLCDNRLTFSTTFDVQSLPCLVLYDKNNKLIEKIKGQTKAETILKKIASST